MTRFRTLITLMLAAGAVILLPHAALAQIRTATIPKGTTRGPIVRPSSPTPPPVYNPTPPTIIVPGYPGYGWHRCHYGCACGRWSWNAWDGYYYEDHYRNAREEARRREQQAFAAASPGLVYASQGPPAPPKPPSNLDRALTALHDGDYNDAVTWFAEAWNEELNPAADPEDEGAAAADPDHTIQRLYAIALIAGGQDDKGLDTLMAAYDADPSLTDRPLRGDAIFSGNDLRQLVRRTVRDAHRDPSYERWFAVAILMQAEGRHQLAAEMIQRAEAARTDAPASSAAS